MSKRLISILILALFFMPVAMAEETFAAKARAAAHPATSDEDIQRYARDSDWNIRVIIARRQTAPANVLIGLAGDKNAEVRSALAHNLRAPRAAVAPLVNDPEQSVRLSLAHCGYTPPDLLEKLVKDSDVDVRQQAVINLNLPYETLKKIAKTESDLTLRAKIMLEQRSDEETLE